MVFTIEGRPATDIVQVGNAPVKVTIVNPNYPEDTQKDIVCFQCPINGIARSLTANTGVLPGCRRDVVSNGGTDWETPAPFGITYKNIDISKFYIAKHTNYNESTTIPIPEGVVRLKVICIGGGEGGLAANSGFLGAKDPLQQNHKGNLYTIAPIPGNTNQPICNKDAWNQGWNSGGEYIVGTWNAVRDIIGNWNGSNCAHRGWLDVCDRYNNSNYNGFKQSSFQNVPYNNPTIWHPAVLISPGYCTPGTINESTPVPPDWNEKGYNYTYFDPIPIFGTAGKNGSDGSYAIGEYVLPNQEGPRNIKIQIGKGGEGGAGKNMQEVPSSYWNKTTEKWNTSMDLLGTKGVNGGDTTCEIISGNNYNRVLTAAGGKNGDYKVIDRTEHPLLRIPPTVGKGGDKGNPTLLNPCKKNSATQNFTTGTLCDKIVKGEIAVSAQNNTTEKFIPFSNAGKGYDGLCRVYFLYK